MARGRPAKDNKASGDLEPKSERVHLGRAARNSQREPCLSPGLRNKAFNEGEVSAKQRRKAHPWALGAEAHACSRHSVWTAAHRPAQTPPLTLAAAESEPGDVLG